MQMPPKPKIEYQIREENGVIVQSLTPESDIAYGRWLQACHLAKIALHKELSGEQSTAQAQEEVEGVTQTTTSCYFGENKRV